MLRLERRFQLQRFVPPALIPRIIASSCDYLRDLHIQVSTNKKKSPNACWKSAIQQQHGHVTIWLWLDDAKDSKLNVNNKYNLNSVKEGAKIRIVGYGNLIRNQEIIDLLDKYSQAVTRVLSEFQGLCHLSQSIICPYCIMSQREDAECGQFNYYDIKQQYENLQIDDCDIFQKSTEEICVRCTKQCSVPFDLLISCGKTVQLDRTTNIPRGDSISSFRSFNAFYNDESQSQNQIKRMERHLKYLTNEIIRLSAVPSESIEGSVASVAWGIIASKDMQKVRNGQGKESFIMVSLGSVASGSFVRLPKSNAEDGPLVVLSCAHFIEDPESREQRKCPEGCEIVYLVGGIFC
jgi:hypothetical protein